MGDEATGNSLTFRLGFHTNVNCLDSVDSLWTSIFVMTYDDCRPKHRVETSSMIQSTVLFEFWSVEGQKWFPALMKYESEGLESNVPRPQSTSPQNSTKLGDNSPKSLTNGLLPLTSSLETHSSKLHPLHSRTKTLLAFARLGHKKEIRALIIALSANNASDNCVLVRSSRHRRKLRKRFRKLPIELQKSVCIKSVSRVQ